VQIENDVVHFQTSLVQLFALLQLNFEEVIQIIELMRFGGAPNGYPFAALTISHAKSSRNLNSWTTLRIQNYWHINRKPWK
jgi:hypothetical protein